MGPKWPVPYDRSKYLPAGFLHAECMLEAPKSHGLYCRPQAFGPNQLRLSPLTASFDSLPRA